MKTHFLLAACGLLVIAANAQTTTRRGLRPLTKQVVTATTSQADTVATTDTLVAPQAHTVDIAGYDKPLRSRRETFFVTNNADKSVEGLAITITYFDRSRRQLHQRPANIKVDIPAGETRQAVLKSWDTQLAFYHINSPVPSRAQQATPYEVKITVDTIFFTR